MADDEIAYGSLSKAKNRTNERGPTHLGKATFKQDVRAGDIAYIAAWIKTGEDGINYYSLKMTEPREKPGRSSSPPPRTARSTDDLDNDLPY